MGTRFSGGNIFCVLLQVNDLLQKISCLLSFVVLIALFSFLFTLIC